MSIILYLTTSCLTCLSPKILQNYSAYFMNALLEYLTTLTVLLEFVDLAFMV